MHGGAGPIRGSLLGAQQEVLGTTLVWAERALRQGAPALDVVEGAIRRLEDSAEFIAGRGARPNTGGQWELDAAICDGPTRKCGAVAALTGVYPPISIARAVMDRTKHVLLAGEGARRFALEQGFAAIDDPGHFFVTGVASGDAAGEDTHGTVGVVALDEAGAIAAGTSTGGTTNKLPGRVGDSPIVGAGTWADHRVGVSCTGQGEYFIRTAAAHAVAARFAAAPASWPGAVAAVLADVAALGGEGGIIAVNLEGEIDYGFTAQAMRIALATSAGRRETGVMRREETR
jgi:L-asparaginase/beta-aspartyl-peptidase (threonine type)